MKVFDGHSQVILANERCLDLFEQILQAEGHATAVEPSADDEQVRHSRVERARAATAALCERIDGNAALLQRSDGMIHVAHASCVVREEKHRERS